MTQTFGKWTTALVFSCSTLVPVAVAQSTIKKTEISRTPAGSGATMYYTYCAACHGSGGKGDGPAAAALKKPMPDLTLLARNNDGEYPAARVMMTLGRIPSSSAHGSAEMPVWGNVFRGSGQNESETQMRIYNLTSFLERLQVPSQPKAKPAKAETLPTRLTGIPANSGSAMYHTLCAGCHGAQGRGDGPAVPNLKGEGLDLTQLARKNNGQFPAQKVSYILGSQSGVAAHGSKEMPIWGDSFRGVGEDPKVVQIRIKNLTDYIKGLQR